MAPRKGPRHLRPEEQELWRQVKRTATPLHPERPEPAPPVARPRPAKPVATDLKDFRIGRTAPQTAPAHDLVPPVSERIGRQPVRMDAKAFGRMKRGKMGIEARLDLHGMTLDQAHPRLVRFILRSYSDGKRLVLVITGKGRQSGDEGPMPARRGILRHQVPEWLQSGPLAGLVLEIRHAHRSHGGGGAYYVYLRRNG